MHPKTNRAAWLHGPPAHCDPPLPPQVGPPWRLVLLGPPGVGKGTLAEWLSESLGACHLSTGDVFRGMKNIPEHERSHAMREALAVMIRGGLVSDATVLELVGERVECLRCRGGFLLDGFPRSVGQAEALEQILRREAIALNGVLNFELPLEEIVERVAARRVCLGCKAVYNLSFKPPKVEGHCDRCGKPLHQRSDDRPEASAVRMRIYEETTAPLIQYYDKAGLLLHVDCRQGSRAAFEATLELLQRMEREGRPGLPASVAAQRA